MEKSKPIHGTLLYISKLLEIAHIANLYTCSLSSWAKVHLNLYVLQPYPSVKKYDVVH